MKAIVVGLGVQGQKRRKFAGSDYVVSVDPINKEAEYRSVENVPLSSYDTALVCIPNEPKVEVLTYLLKNGEDFQIVSAHCFENREPDHVVMISKTARPKLEFEMTLLSWRNHFTCDVFAEKGTAHIRSLCKWGPATFIHRTRILPSGRPPE